MTITRVYASPDGESHFEDAEVPLRGASALGLLSSAVPAREVAFRESEPNADSDWHPALQRHYIVLLDGPIEIETSDGERRRFQGGDVVLVEDTHGKGHRMRTGGGRPRSVVVSLPDGPAPALDVVQEAGEDSFPASDAPAWTGTTLG